MVGSSGFPLTRTWRTRAMNIPPNMMHIQMFSLLSRSSFLLKEVVTCWNVIIYKKPRTLASPLMSPELRDSPTSGVRAATYSKQLE